MLFDQNWKFYLLFFLGKIGQNSVFCDLVDRELAILDYKNIHLNKSKILHFSNGLSPLFLAKNLKFGPFFLPQQNKSKEAVLETCR